MAFITDILNTIKNAHKGKDMRQAIYDGIQQCYEDATGHPDSVAAAVKKIGEVSANLSKETADRKAEVNTERKRIDNLIKELPATAGEYQQSKLVLHSYDNAAVKCTTTSGNYTNVPAFTTDQGGPLSSLYTKKSNYQIAVNKSGLYLFELRIHVNSLIANKRVELAPFVNDTRIAALTSSYNTAGNFALTQVAALPLWLSANDTVDFRIAPIEAVEVSLQLGDVLVYAIDWEDKFKIPDYTGYAAETKDIRTGADGTVYGTAGEAVRKQIGNITEELSNLLEEGTQILDWKNAKVVNGYFTSISDFKSSDVSRTVIIPVDYSKGDTISIHRGIMGERFVYGYTSIEMPKIGDILDYANVQNNAERVILRIKSDTKNILLYYYNSTLDNYDSDDILASIMVQYGKVYTGYEPYGEPRGKKDIINKINGNSEKLISAVYNSPSIFDDVSNPISKGDHFYLYVKDIVGAKYSDIEFYFFRSDNTYKRVIHNINIGELYAITADEDYTKYRIRIVVESTTSNDMIYAIYNIFQSNGISAINISAKVYDLALDNNKKVEQLTANNLNTCNIFRKVIACGDSYTAGYIVSKTGEIHNVNEEYAWPHYMETITGNTWVNCGHSGANAYTWQTAERGLPKAKASGKAQAYILGLMINDSSTDSTRNLKLGTISDIGTDEISYYGQYTKIIKELFNISPNAKVFIETCPKVEGDRYIGYNQAVYDIYDKLKPNYPNLHLLDLFKHYSMYTNASLTKDSLSGHYTAIGYQQFAQILSVILSSYINEHISDFQDVAFIEYDN